MPRSAPLKVRISPNAVRIVGCISPNGGQQNPASNNRPPNTHRLTDNINWTFFINPFQIFLHEIPTKCVTSWGERRRPLQQRPFLVEHIRIEAWVLVLYQSVCCLIYRQLYWVQHTTAGVSHTGCELSTVCDLRSWNWSWSFAVFYAIVAFACPAMCKADFVALSHFSVDLVHLCRPLNSDTLYTLHFKP